MKASLNSHAFQQPVKIDSRPSAVLREIPPVKPTRRYTPEEIQQHRYKVKKIAAGIFGAGIAALLVTPRTSAEPELKLTRDEATICEIGTATQHITFQPGDGRNTAIVAIKGSGDGIGDPCWSEAYHAVDKALEGREPQYDQTIEIPAEVHPVKNQPTIQQDK